MRTQESKKVAMDIGSYIRSISKDVKDATSTMEAMKITDVSYNDGVVSIKTTRPGVVIGRRGELINGITKSLTEMKDVKVCKVQIIEDVDVKQLNGDLYFFQYEDYDRSNNW